MVVIRYIMVLTPLWTQVIASAMYLLTAKIETRRTDNSCIGN
ncbi:MAG: hypothetical protein WBA07_17670 [Rivularia sp. (in: cyanobacteria)]